MEGSLCPYYESPPWFGLNPALVLFLSPPTSIIEAAGGFIVGVFGPPLGFLSVLLPMIWIILHHETLTLIQGLVAWCGLSGAMRIVLREWNGTLNDFDTHMHYFAETIETILTLPLEATLIVTWLTILFSGCWLFTGLLDVYAVGVVYVLARVDVHEGLLLWLLGSYILMVFELFNPRFPM